MSNMNQLTLEDARVAAEDAMRRVEDHAGESFCDCACVCILEQLSRCGQASSESLSMGCRAIGIIPHDDRAFGPVFMRLVRQGRIEKCGTCPRVRGHGTSGGNVWKLRTLR